MDSQYECCKCQSKWGISKSEEAKDKVEMCPICTFEEVNNCRREIKALNEKLESYREVLLDLGIKNIESNREATTAELNDACMYYTHDFGLLEADKQYELRHMAREWFKCFRKAGIKI